jgi:hypothetical protein
MTPASEVAFKETNVEVAQKMKKFIPKEIRQQTMTL